MFKISKNKAQFLVKRHKDYKSSSESVQKRFLEHLKNTPELYLKTKYTISSRKFSEMTSDVGREIHYHKMFTRLQIEHPYLLSGMVQPEHLIEDLLLKFFYQRFPNYCVVLESIVKRKTFFIAPKHLKSEITQLHQLKSIEIENKVIGISNLNRQKVVNLFIEILKDYKEKYEILEEGLDPEGLFKSFYGSQYISSRKNLRLFNKNMPKKYQNKKDMKVERAFLNKSMDEFLSSNKSK